MAMGMMAALQMQKLLARRRQLHAHEERFGGDWDFLMSGRNIVTCVLLATAFVLYTQLLCQDIVQSRNFPGYLTPKVPAAATDDLHKSEDSNGPGLGSPARQTDIAGSPSPTAQPRDGPEAMILPQVANLIDAPAAAPRSIVPTGKIKVLIGVFIMAFEYNRRAIIRSANRVQSSQYADFTVRFVVGDFSLPQWLANENATHRDFIVLQCKENLNAGKTFAFFSTLPTIFGGDAKFDYVMKTDDDSYVRFESLGKHLWLLPRTDLYYGYSLPCGQPPRVDFRAGAGYVLSWDLVLWIGESPIPRNNTIGTEDRLVGQWFVDGGVARNKPVEKGFLFHDHPKQGGVCSRNITTESILVHKLKSDERYLEVIAFFEMYNN